MDSILFPKSIGFIVVGLEKWSKDLGFENFNEILSLLDFEFTTRALLRLPSSFPSQLFFISCSKKGVYEVECW